MSFNCPFMSYHTTSEMWVRSEPLSLFRRVPFLLYPGLLIVVGTETKKGVGSRFRESSEEY